VIPGRRVTALERLRPLREVERLMTAVVRAFTVAADAAGKDGRAAVADGRMLDTTAVTDKSALGTTAVTDGRTLGTTAVTDESKVGTTAVADESTLLRPLTGTTAVADERTLLTPLTAEDTAAAAEETGLLAAL
jgi:hypothetical protein